jgi:shikimate kinase
MHNHKAIILVGPMGAGKTTLGRRLGKLLGRLFVDSDHEIEARTGVEIAYIFEKEGEVGFREREHSVIDELLSLPDVVLATGGGAVGSEKTRASLQARGIVIYLQTTVNQQLERTANSTHRPLLRTANPRQKLTDLLEIRDPLYREVADLVVDTSSKNSNMICKEIVARLDAMSS